MSRVAAIGGYEENFVIVLLFFSARIRGTQPDDDDDDDDDDEPFAFAGNISRNEKTWRSALLTSST